MTAVKVSSNYSLRICRVATIPFSIVHHLKNQIKSAKERGHDVTVIASPGPDLEQLANELTVRVYPVNIQRTFSPWADLKALFKLHSYFRKMRFDIVHSITPKAALLCALGSFLAGIPVRLHTFTGQPWETLSGPMRWFAKASDRLVVRLNTKCYADSHSQAAYLTSQRISKTGEMVVLGNGCLSGVDLIRFNPNAWNEQATSIKKELGIPERSRIITFIGRITKDKGVSDLVAALQRIFQKYVDVHLLLVGPFEPERDPLPTATLEYIKFEPKIKVIGYTSEPERFLAISDIFCIPSYREGFGTVVIEAAAMGVPAVGTKIVGLVDSIVDGKTGILVPPRNLDKLVEALLLLLSNDTLRNKMGEKARQRANKFFDEQLVSQYVLNEYDKLAMQRLH